jgi:hypothetical protein
MDITLAFTTFRENYNRVVSQLEERFGVEKRQEVPIHALETAAMSAEITQEEVTLRAPIPVVGRALLPPEGAKTPQTTPTASAVVIDLDRTQHVDTEHVAVEGVFDEDEIRQEAMRTQAAARKCCCFPFFRR